MVKLSKPISTMILACVLGIAGAQSALAQVNFPDKPISIHVGFPPGTSTDSIARILGEKMSKDLGQPIIVRNKPGSVGP